MTATEKRAARRRINGELLAAIPQSWGFDSRVVRLYGNRPRCTFDQIIAVVEPQPGPPHDWIYPVDWPYPPTDANRCRRCPAIRGEPSESLACEVTR